MKVFGVMDFPTHCKICKGRAQIGIPFQHHAKNHSEHLLEVVRSELFGSI